MGACILVVDDDQDIREALQEILEDDGYEVRLASDGRQVLDLVGRGLRPDLVLLDLMMPAMDGWELLGHRAQHDVLAHVPFVVLSAVRPERLEGLEGASVLSKPVDLEALLSLITTLLHQTGEGRADP